MKIATFEVSTSLGRITRLGAFAEREETGRLIDLTAAFASHLGTKTDEPTPRELAQLRTPPDMVGWLRAGP